MQKPKMLNDMSINRLNGIRKILSYTTNFILTFAQTHIYNEQVKQTYD